MEYYMGIPCQRQIKGSGLKVEDLGFTWAI